MTTPLLPYASGYRHYIPGNVYCADALALLRGLHRALGGLFAASGYVNRHTYAIVLKIFAESFSEMVCGRGLIALDRFFSRQPFQRVARLLR